MNDHFKARASKNLGAMPGLGAEGAPTVDSGFRIHDVPDDRSHAKARPQRHEHALAAIEQPRQNLRLIAEFVKEQFRARPYTALAVALGLGFAIGGGLSTRLGRAALATAGRYGLKELLKQRA